ncbi:MAG TPA: phytanoyl-CoA dioxygenase family protein [Flavilitoribacter sp.]|mgnify:CR=1 FL=1|nr:phytanoyl-CoA dioxygenase family protein [Flavilitoribacter sp.]HMQ90070.1 phytanoyl-CoA dioxygenase family protein [Flavilitoribacter sp.]
MIKDLATEHHPVSDLFPQPATPGEWEQYRISDEQVAFFRENGYLSGIRILDDRQIEVLRKELAELTDPDHPGHHLFYEYHSNESTDPDTVVFHALGHWRITPGFHDVLWSPAFLMAAHQLLGGGVRFWHDQIFSKPARHGGVVAWHQDYSYWTRTGPMNHLTCWIGLDDADRQNGCLNYIPGSHRWGLLDRPTLTGEMEGLMQFLDPDQRKAMENPAAIELKAGHCTFHHPLMVHGSYANYTERPRRAFVLNVFKDGVISNSDEVLLEGVPVIPKGEKMEGRFFPLLMEGIEGT